MGKQLGNKLKTFAQKTGAPAMYDWKDLGYYTAKDIGEGGFEAAFKIVTDKVIKTKGSIHFNLNSVRLDKIKNFIGKGLYEGDDSAFMQSMITEWELGRVFSNPNLLKRANFYKMGIKIPTKIVEKYIK